MKKKAIKFLVDGIIIVATVVYCSSPLFEKKYCKYNLCNEPNNLKAVESESEFHPREYS